MQTSGREYSQQSPQREIMPGMLQKLQEARLALCQEGTSGETKIRRLKEKCGIYEDKEEVPVKPIF